VNKTKRIKSKDDFFITASLKFSTIYITLNLKGNYYGKNILENTVIRSTTLPQGVENICRCKLAILIVRSNKWLMIGK